MGAIISIDQPEFHFPCIIDGEPVDREERIVVRYRARETGMYQGAPYVDEWKPLPPRLHDARTLQRDGLLAAPVAVEATEPRLLVMEPAFEATELRTLVTSLGTALAPLAISEVTDERMEFTSWAAAREARPVTAMAVKRMMDG